MSHCFHGGQEVQGADDLSESRPVCDVQNDAFLSFFAGADLFIEYVPQQEGEGLGEGLGVEGWEKKA